MLTSYREWQIAGVAAGVAVAAGIGLWMVTRKRPTADELEVQRRMMLVQMGRIVDGMLADSFEITDDDGMTRSMLLYHYQIAGVNYECSQDITLLREIVDPTCVKVGMPCSIRYQPGIPENSILVAEGWSGLRGSVSTAWLLRNNQDGCETLPK